MQRVLRARGVLGVVLVFATVVLGGVGNVLFGLCGPFTDVSDAVFCPFVLEIFYLGITTGTTATTYSPADNVTRLQMAAFLSRTVDGSLRRGSRRAAMNQFWTLKRPEIDTPVAVFYGVSPLGLPAADGGDIWASSEGSGVVCRFRASDGRLLETWTGAASAAAAVVGAGRVFVTGNTAPGALYRIVPLFPPGLVGTVATNLGDFPNGIAFDGAALWTANSGGSVSTVTVGAGGPYPVSTVTTGFSSPIGALYDGANVWVTDNVANTLLKLDASAGVLQTVTVGDAPRSPIFDGTNIWVPNNGSASVSVVRVSSGALLATLTGNGLNGPYAAAFDGLRVLVTNPIADSVSLWKAADLSPLGTFNRGTSTQP